MFSSSEGTELTLWSHYQHYSGPFYSREYRISASYRYHIRLTGYVVFLGKALLFSLVDHCQVMDASYQQYKVVTEV
jgi:hypothetical protein